MENWFFDQSCFLGSALERLDFCLNEGFIFSNNFPCVMARILTALGQSMLLLGCHFSWGPLAPLMEICTLGGSLGHWGLWQVGCDRDFPRGCPCHWKKENLKSMGDACFNALPVLWDAPVQGTIPPAAAPSGVLGLPDKTVRKSLCLFLSLQTWTYLWQH